MLTIYSYATEATAKYMPNLIKSSLKLFSVVSKINTSNTDPTITYLKPNDIEIKSKQHKYHRIKMTRKRDENYWEKASITLEIKDLRRHQS
jgi:S-adenosylmethionine synthetase